MQAEPGPPLDPAPEAGLHLELSDPDGLAAGAAGQLLAVEDVDGGGGTFFWDPLPPPECSGATDGERHRVLRDVPLPTDRPLRLWYALLAAPGWSYVGPPSSGPLDLFDGQILGIAALEPFVLGEASTASASLTAYGGELDFLEPESGALGAGWLTGAMGVEQGSVPERPLGVTISLPMP